LYWNIPTDRIFCTGTSPLTEYFVLEGILPVSSIFGTKKNLALTSPMFLMVKYFSCSDPNRTSLRNYSTVGTSFSLKPRPSLKKKFILKNDLLLVFQKRRLRLDTNSKCQHGNEVHRQKNSHFDDDFDFGIKKTDTCSQGYYCQTKSSVRNCQHSKNEFSKKLSVQ
jgi:hypothetical protein